jgi:hypothetical protein
MTRTSGQEVSQPIPPTAPWWKTASLEELEQSPALVKRFIAKAEGRGDDDSVPPETFARAIGLDTLFADDRTFELLVMLVNTRLDDVDDALAFRADEQKQATWSETLQTAKECCAVLERCAELLSKALSESVVNAVRTLAKRAGTLNTAAVVFVTTHGTNSSFVAPARATFKPAHRRPDT